MADGFLHETISEGFHIREKLGEIFYYIFVCMYICMLQKDKSIIHLAKDLRSLSCSAISRNSEALFHTWHVLLLLTNVFCHSIVTRMKLLGIWN